jgi:transcriptional regulatory protein RtcR
VALCQHDDLLLTRFELLYQPRFTRLAQVVVEDMAAVAPETTVRLTPLALDDPWDFEQVYGALHDFARAYTFVPDQEDYLVHITTGSHVAQICLFLLTESRFFPARLLQTAPPHRRDHDWRGSFKIIDLDLSKYDRLAARFRQEQREAVSFLKSGIETRNAHFNQLIARIEQVALVSRDPMLFMGPTGAGKSQLAKRLYELKRVRHQVQGLFVEVNCATLRGDGAMSALFGHVKGAFTGAQRDRPGLLRTAHEGVLFLDEIGELGLDEQAMLLRALEEKVFLPLGSDVEVRSNFQLIAGTNRDLGEMMRAGRFRDDLLARINLWTFRLPGLRERVEDIAPNLDYELAHYAQRTGTHVTFSREARTRFLQFAVSPAALWSGNFRDLNAAMVRMATLAPGGRISLEVVEEEIVRLHTTWRASQLPEPASACSRWLDEERLTTLDLFDRIQLDGVLAVCQRSRTLSEAGRALFRTSRTQKTTVNDADRLRKYLARFHLDWQQIQQIAREGREAAP